MIEFSKEAGCWVYLCPWGCYDLDFEGEQEAKEAFLRHACPGEPPC